MVVWCLWQSCAIRSLCPNLQNGVISLNSKGSARQLQVQNLQRCHGLVMIAAHNFTLDHGKNIPLRNNLWSIISRPVICSKRISKLGLICSSEKGFFSSTHLTCYKPRKFLPFKFKDRACKNNLSLFLDWKSQTIISDQHLIIGPAIEYKPLSLHVIGCNKFGPAVST